MICKLLAGRAALQCQHKDLYLSLWSNKCLKYFSSGLRALTWLPPEDFPSTSPSHDDLKAGVLIFSLLHVFLKQKNVVVLCFQVLKLITPSLFVVNQRDDDDFSAVHTRPRLRHFPADHFLDVNLAAVRYETLSGCWWASKKKKKKEAHNQKKIVQSSCMFVCIYSRQFNCSSAEDI